MDGEEEGVGGEVPAIGGDKPEVRRAEGGDGGGEATQVAGGRHPTGVGEG